MGNDPIDEMSEHLRTVIGSDEVALTARLGNEGYKEEYKRRADLLEDLVVIDKSRHSEHTKQSAAFIAAKAGFWRSVSAAIAAGVIFGAGWSIWEWVR